MYREHNWLKANTDEFDICQCGHKKIHHGSSHKIYKLDTPETIRFGCIECIYEFSKPNISITGFTTQSSRKSCDEFTPIYLSKLKRSRGFFVTSEN